LDLVREDQEIEIAVGPKARLGVEATEGPPLGEDRLDPVVTEMGHDFRELPLEEPDLEGVIPVGVPEG
jgi:hypothetical protein